MMCYTRKVHFVLDKMNTTRSLMHNAEMIDAHAKPCEHGRNKSILPVFHGRDVHATVGFARAPIIWDTEMTVRTVCFWAFVILVAMNAKRLNFINPFVDDGRNKTYKLIFLIIGLLATVIHIIGNLILKLGDR